MDFKTKKIRKEPKPPKPKKQRPAISFKNAYGNKYRLHLATAGGSAILIIILLLGLFTIVKSLDFSRIVFSFGKSLQTDGAGNTNILLVGTGGEDHDGANLTDTIIVAKIDYNEEIVPMLSIPRDFYIMKKQQRINSIYDWGNSVNGDNEGILELKETVEEITGLNIQYYVKVDFEGFTKIIDSLGGVDVNVSEKIYDPYYPKGESIYYETFELDAGPQTLDGATALKYARSRKTTSDFDRARRQQELLFAIKEKALNLGILTNPGKIGNIYDSIDKSIETDLSLAEIIELGKIGKDFQKENLFPLVINDDPTSCGGLVYTPAREYFSGASVLLPVGKDYDYVHLFVDLVFKNIGSIAKSDDYIQILNGTKTSGLAYETLNILSRFCLNISYYGNAPDRTLEKSTIYYKPDEEGNPPPIINLVNSLMPGIENRAGIPENYLETEARQKSTIVVELGSDYLNKRHEEPFNKLNFLAPATDETTDAEKQIVEPETN
ncbi:LCP family protein [Patescibacteria group bacterium]|nr:LCP family protein [Patescibacteria group bacterium]MBU1703675.1 LCP family protein [Patescibacteria group bacterium]MBU1953942.1 LCP family protein [Patescibacteria group bacterium]